ncbi:hypothetical protein ABMY26_00075 (plasmid) [Azospirillum sp. HJ39]|uniref:hypothetical protein n=1 Tax=Azospirillum sp. HJ39 TaxID=3159496 RepID=UPI00355643F2
MAEPVYPAVAAEAARLIRQAMKRMVNDQPETKPMSPERLRWTETTSMLWTAAALLNPQGLHDEDAKDIAARIAELETSSDQ